MSAAMSQWRLRTGLGLVWLTIGLTAVVGCASPSSDAARPVVTVFGTLNGSDTDDFAASVAGFERSSGVDVRYVGSSHFEADLLERLRRGDPPDLALLPQPGLLDTLVEDGFAVPWTGDLGAAATDDVDPRLVDRSTIDGSVYGAWYQLTLKSLVWYSPGELARRGLEVPTTWAELEALTAEISQSGVTPWCIGIRDGGATGWVATDWVEDLVLRFAGADVYDQWVDHEVLFGDAPIVDAVERFGAIALDRDLVHGGSRGAVERTIAEAAAGLVASPPRCLLHRQASFLPNLLGTDVTFAPDGDLWAFPLPANGGGEAPLVVGGSLVVRFSDGGDADRLASFLTTPEAAQARAERGGFVSALDSFDLDGYASPIDRAVAGWLREADVLRFDASDLMPPEVGVGAFWTAMTSWLGGARLQPVLAEIDAAWPVDVVPLDEEADDG